MSCQTDLLKVKLKVCAKIFEPKYSRAGLTSTKEISIRVKLHLEISQDAPRCRFQLSVWFFQGALGKARSELAIERSNGFGVWPWAAAEDEPEQGNGKGNGSGKLGLQMPGVNLGGFAGAARKWIKTLIPK